MNAIELKEGSTAILDAVFRTARQHPFYRDQFENVSSFDECPVLDRKTLFQRISDNLHTPGFLKGLYISPSGGSSTGTPTYVPVDARENQRQRLLFSRHLIQQGFFSEDSVVLNVMPNTMMYRSSEIITDFCMRAGATSLPLAEETSNESVLEAAKLFRPDTLAAMPTRLMELADFCVDGDFAASFDSVIFGGEPLTEERRGLLRKLFSVQRFFGLYGSSEAGMWAYQPPQCHNDTYVMAPGLVHAEIFNAGADGFGNLVLTNLVRRRNPLVRYDSGDIARFVTVVIDDQEVEAFELKKRVSACFQIGAVRFTVDEHISGCANFQICIDFDEAAATEKLSFFLVPEPNMSESQRVAALNGIKSKYVSQVKPFATEVHFVQVADLIKSPTSHKPIRLVDRRS